MHYRFILFSILLFCCVSTRSFGEEWWTNFTVEDGLESKNIRCLAADQQGAVWIVYIDALGVSKFDGTTIKTYTTHDGLGSNLVMDIVVDADGVVWVATNWGVSKFDGVAWNNYQFSEEYNPIYSVAVDKQGVMWAGLYPGLLSFNGLSWKMYTPEDGYEYALGQIITIDSLGNKWIGSNRGGGTTKYDGNESTVYNSYDSGLPGNEILSIFVDTDDAVWFGTDGKDIEQGVTVFDGTNWKTYREEDGLVDNNVRAIAQDSHGTYWFGTRSGLSRFDGTSWVSYKTTDGLIGNYIRSITIDNDDTVWIGTTNGISKLEQEITSVNETEYPEQPDVFGIQSIHPNPFNPFTSISYTIVEGGHTELSVYNMSGQKVAVLVEGDIPAGTYGVSFNGNGMGSGIYFCRIETSEFTQIRKMLLIK